MLKHIAKVLLFTAGMCAGSTAFSGEPTMSNPLLSNPRPWCIGRFVFDRPATSEISNQRYEVRGDRLETQYNVSAETYRSKIDALDKTLRTNQRVNPVNLSEKTGHAWLERVVSPTRDSRVFVYQEGVAKAAKLPFSTEGFIYADGTLFHTTGWVGSSAIDRVDEIYDDTYRRIKARNNLTVPAEAGFCFDGGIVTGASPYGEKVSQSFTLMPGRPALLVIQMRNSIETDQSAPLTKTLPELKAQLNRLPGHYRILREGKRTVAGMNAEEVLFEIKDGGVTSYQFYLLAPGEPSMLSKPHTAIQLLLGANSPDLTPDQAASPVDETGAFQVWDTLLNSLRLRPGAL
jgi:hypothetical protein